MSIYLPANPRELGMPHDEWRTSQRETAEWALNLGNGVAICEQPTGCHRVGQGVLMYDGTVKRVEDVEGGDWLMGANGEPRIVLALTRGVGQMALIQPIKGQPFVVNLDHVLTLIQTGTRSGSPSSHRKAHLGGEIIDVTVREWLTWSKHKKWIHKLLRRDVIHFGTEQSEFFIEPYLMGLLLGDGCLTHGTCVAKPDPEILTYLETVAEQHGMRVRGEWKKGRSVAHHLVNPSRGNIPNPFTEALRGMGLCCLTGSKFIPQAYKTASRLDRLQLLAGLLDTDGYIGKCSYDYISKSEQLANDVTFVARSLGLAAYLSPCQKYCQTGAGGTYYRVSISGNLEWIPNRIPRKKATPRCQIKDVLRTGFAVTVLPDPEPFYGFTLDGDGRYLLDDFTVTHNSGKSAVSYAISSQRRNVTLTRTRGLQEQYRSIYNYALLYGRNNYPCTHPERAHPNATAEECLFGEDMGECPFVDNCPYHEAKLAARQSRAAILNYAYWMVAGKGWPPVGALVLDEAHLVPDIVIEHAGITIRQKEALEWDLPDFPAIKLTGNMGSLAAFDDSLPQAFSWLKQVKNRLKYHGDRLNPATRYLNDKERARAKSLENLKRKVDASLEAITYAPEDWFVWSGPGTVKYRDEMQAGFTAKPFTARYAFPAMFINPERLLFIMSATIGAPEVLSAELGLGSKFSFRVVPNQWSPETRPVYALDVPSMGRSNTSKHPEAFEKQADVIAKAILEVPHEWSGFVHVTRKTEALLMAQRLARRGLEDRVWVPPGADAGSWVPSNEQTIAWEKRRKEVPNSLCVGWSMWEGVDGREEKIDIVAKCFTPDVFLFGPDGYLSAESAHVGDRVFAIREDGQLVVDTVMGVVRKSYSGDVHHLTASKYDLTVTPDHRMLFKTSNDTRHKTNAIWRVETAGDALAHYGSLPCAADRWEGKRLQSIEFSQFFLPDTVIYYRPAVGGRKPRDLPSCFRLTKTRFHNGQYGHMYRAHWADLQGANWAPRVEDTAFFADTPHSNKVPYHWSPVAFARLAGWFASEGHTSYWQSAASGVESWRIGLSQKRGEVFDSMVAALAGLGLAYSVGNKQTREVETVTVVSRVLHAAFQNWFGKGARSKTLPRFLLDADEKTLRLIFCALMEGDGNARQDTYTTASPRLRDAFVELCLKLGFAPSYKRFSDCYHVYFSKGSDRNYSPMSNHEVSPYAGEVWCVTTAETGNLLATRNGKFVFTGNCPFPYIGDDYERYKQAYSMKLYKQRAAYQLEQGLGRTRRGNPEDYDDATHVRGLVGIADGDWIKVQDFISQSLKEALVKP